MNLDVLTGLRPVYRRLLGQPVPLQVFEKLYGDEPWGFLYESLEARGTRGRFSFVGGRPRLTFQSRGRQIRLTTPTGVQQFQGRTLETLRQVVQAGREALPVATFPGGAVGYLGYDVVRDLAPVPDDNPDDLKLPDAQFVFPEEILIFDHLDEVVHLLIYAGDGEKGRAEERLREIETVLAGCEGEEEQRPPAIQPAGAAPVEIRSNLTEEQFSRSVIRAKEMIRAGEIFQGVLSQRFEFPLQGSALDLYRALRRTNPSPYMYYLQLDGLQIAGSSPEMLVKLTGRRVVTRPLAGTRPRGATPDEDEALARELLADDKERAEHVMLVDLSRNDLGRVCQTGSVRVDEYLEIERYARVMHLVSNVTGRLRDDLDAFDLFAATFPAGTVSGAPKVRAMQIIDELEPVRRGPYAGAIGYFSFLGDMDLCIAIRTILVQGRRGYLQAGAGIVADSIPEREYAETLNKARGLVQAVQLMVDDR